jgi:hypothetical protein
MKPLVKNLFLLLGLWLVLVPTADAQTNVPSIPSTRSIPATAAPVSPSIGVPSAASIQQNFLNQRQAALTRQLRDATRCLQNAQINLRDAAGVINRVKSTDIINCSRRVTQLLTQLKKVGQLSTSIQSEAAQAQALAAALAGQITQGQ